MELRQKLPEKHLDIFFFLKKTPNILPQHALWFILHMCLYLFDPDSQLCTQFAMYPDPVYVYKCHIKDFYLIFIFIFKVKNVTLIHCCKAINIQSSEKSEYFLWGAACSCDTAFFIHTSVRGVSQIRILFVL